MYLESSESLETAESKLVVEKSHSEKVTYKRAWLTIAQMKDHGMKKIATVVSRGGFADPEAPLDEASTRYPVTVSMEEEEEWKSKTSVSSSAEIQHTDALRIHGLGAPSAGTSVMSPDPTALVQQQLLAHAASSTPSVAAPSTPASTAGSRAAGQLVSLIVSVLY
eukprot:Skav223678  [mRNA]  locus=scaffold2691:189718:190307:- [translate_table: standard]